MRMSTLSHCGHRSTNPGALAKTRTAPTSATAPQLSQRPRAVVSSKEKSSRKRPAAAFPSSFRSCSSTSSSRGSEALGADVLGCVAYAYEAVGDRLDESCRATDVGQALGIRIRHLAKHRVVHPAGVPCPAGRLLPRQRVNDVESAELIPVDHVVERPRRVEETGRDIRRRSGPVAKHRHEWDDSRSASDE